MNIYSKLSSFTTLIFLKCYIAYIARFLGQQYQNICPSVTGRIVFAYYVNYNLQWEIFIEFILKIKIVYFEMMNLRILRYRKGRYCIFLYRGLTYYWMSFFLNIVNWIWMLIKSMMFWQITILLWLHQV